MSESGLREYVVYLRARIEAEDAAEAENALLFSMEEVPAEIYVDKVRTVSRTRDAMRARGRRAATPLTDTDEAILSYLEGYQTPRYGGEIAKALGLKDNRAIGSRLVGLRKRELVESATFENATRMLGWRITERGRDR